MAWKESRTIHAPLKTLEERVKKEKRKASLTSKAGLYRKERGGGGGGGGGGNGQE